MNRVMAGVRDPGGAEVLDTSTSPPTERLSPLEIKIDVELDQSSPYANVRTDAPNARACTFGTCPPSGCLAGTAAGCCGPVGVAWEARALPTDSAERKRTPLCTGLLDYCPAALDLIAHAADHELPPADAYGFDLEDIVLSALRYRDRDGAPDMSQYRQLCLAALAILHRELTGDPPAHVGAVTDGLRPCLATLFYVHGLALAEVARVSWHGNAKHNPGQALHHSRAKSADHEDCAVRHVFDNMYDPGGFDGELMHAACLVWRCFMLTQIMLEQSGAPQARGAR